MAIFLRILAVLFPWVATVGTAFVTRMLYTLGFGVATFTGLTLVLDELLGYITSSFSDLPADIVGMLGLYGIDTAMNIMLSSGVALMVFKGISASSHSRMVWRRPGDKSPISWDF